VELDVPATGQQDIAIRLQSYEYNSTPPKVSYGKMAVKNDSRAWSMQKGVLFAEKGVPFAGNEPRLF
jgi:hypothetical protein